jgi:hypothetical protein
MSGDMVVGQSKETKDEMKDNKQLSTYSLLGLDTTVALFFRAFAYAVLTQIFAAALLRGWSLRGAACHLRSTRQPD